MVDTMIGSAVQRGAVVHIYNEHNQQTATVLAKGTGNQDGLVGYTQSRVSVRRGAYLYQYGERGEHLGTVLAG
jgi:hypothetical protein